MKVIIPTFLQNVYRYNAWLLCPAQGTTLTKISLTEKCIGFKKDWG